MMTFVEGEDEGRKDVMKVFEKRVRVITLNVPSIGEQETKMLIIVNAH